MKRPRLLCYNFDGNAPSPLAPCLAPCSTPAEAPSLGPLASSALLLSSTRFVRSVAPAGTAVRHAAAETSPAAALCCGGFRSPGRAHEQTKRSTRQRFAPVRTIRPVLDILKYLRMRLLTAAWAVSAVSHLDEHGAGLGGDGGQLLQEPLSYAQVLLQTLVLG